MSYPTKHRTPRFLVVDDIDTGRKVLAAMMSRFGRVDVAGSAAEALEKLGAADEEGDAYDLLLLDIMMPEMDGIQLLCRVREQERRTGKPPAKAVMTTALDEREHIEAALEAGASGYLLKPLSIGKVTSQLQKLNLLAG